MSTSATLDNIRSRILAKYVLLFLKTWEEDRWESELAELALEIERGLVIWTVTEGPQPPPDSSDGVATDPLKFLEQIESYPPDHIFLLKDFHSYLDDPQIVRKLRDLLPMMAESNKTLMLIGPSEEVPIELKKEAVVLELPLPGLEELRTVWAEVLEENNTDGSGSSLQVTPDEEERLAKTVLGLTLREARKALARAILAKDVIDDDVYALLVSEKKHMVQGSELLEFYDLDEGVGDVGGLDGLKDWLKHRAEGFSSRAQEQGIPVPKGVLLLGVQGCGKSLTARATARLLSFPLVRLDTSTLLSSDQGGSERNIRDVLHLMETIAPAVLWLDEIEKGFAGSEGTSNQDPTMLRLVGRFLTWMEERRAQVFVVATANSIQNLPPEMLRRGRFDELFFIDLPNYDERRNIFDIHLAKRGWKPEKFDVEDLATQTEGYSGAEIEQIVVSAMLESFGQGRILSQQDLQTAREDSVPLSITMEEKIFELREWARTRCRPATLDSRVMQMLEEEQRAGTVVNYDADDQPEEWKELADHGQYNAAMAAYVRRYDHVTFPQLQESFAQYMETEGNMGLALKSDANVVLWLGLSEELAELLANLIASKRLYLHPIEAARYKTTGRVGKYPVLEALPEDRLSKPAWIPIGFRNLPLAEGSGRFARVGRIKLNN